MKADRVSSICQWAYGFWDGERDRPGRCRPASGRPALWEHGRADAWIAKPSTVFHKYDNVCCAAFGLGLGATREHTRDGSVTEEQQRPKPKATQPSGRQRFSSQTSLLAPYRSLAGTLVARASSGLKISCGKR